MLNHVPTVDLHLESEATRPMNVLVLDDSEVDRRRIMRLCEDAGLIFTATEAANLNELYDAFANKQFDLVFIDYLLADEDGLDAVRFIAEDDQQSAISIMVAGEGRLDIAIEAMRLGCSDYLTKSNLAVDSLQKAVATALERRMTSLALREENERRRKLELAVKHYANACSMEMRTLLAATLRRVRQLRRFKTSEEQAAQLSELETNIDQLWDALPEFNETTLMAINSDDGKASAGLVPKH